MKLPQNTVQSLIHTIYPGIYTLSADHHHNKYFLEHISAHNDDVDELNTNLLNKFTEDETVFHSAD
ncbi:hypothetical protein C8R45DRAFT_761371, partial [Mycena sanguinolenta]